MKEIFVDYANACPVDERVFSAMKPFFIEKFGNPSSHIISKGNEALKALDESRKIVADFIGAEGFEIVFTSCATESNNLAIKGTAFQNILKGKHILTSEIEHFSITSPLRTLEQSFGFNVDYIPVDNDGIVDESALKKLLRKDTVLVTIQLGNNEIGTIQDIKGLVKIVKEFNENIIFHCDACACGGLLDINVNDLGVDLLTLSAVSMYGPKGVSCLYIRKGVIIRPLIEGGFQEGGLRSGTENLPAIVGFAKACEIAKQEIKHRAEYLSKLRDKLRDGIENNIDFVHITGHRTRRLPNNYSFWIEFAEGESLLLMLNYLGVMASSGSACSSNLRARDEDELVGSHVLAAVGVPTDICSGSITFMLGKDSTEEEVDYVLETLPPIIQRLWSMSPSYEDMLKNKK